MVNRDMMDFSDWENEARKRKSELHKNASFSNQFKMKRTDIHVLPLEWVINILELYWNWKAKAISWSYMRYNCAYVLVEAPDICHFRVYIPKKFYTVLFSPLIYQIPARVFVSGMIQVYWPFCVTSSINVIPFQHQIWAPIFLDFLYFLFFFWFNVSKYWQNCLDSLTIFQSFV